MAQSVKDSTCNAGDLDSIPELRRFPWRRERLPTPVFLPGEFHGLYSPWGQEKSDITERLSLSNAGEPGSGRSPKEGNGYSLQYSCLGNSMDKR